MALPTPHHTSLLCLLLLLSTTCLLLTDATSSSPARRRPHARRQRNAGCAESCANTSEMTRCLRMACRKYAMGSLIRFGKRSRAGSDLSLLPPSRPSQRERILENLLLHEALGTSQHQGRQLQLEPSEFMARVMSPVRLAGQPLSSHYPLLSSSSRVQFDSMEPESKQLRAIIRKLPLPRPDERDDTSQLYEWLAQASRNVGHGELPPEEALQTAPSQHSPVSSYQQLQDFQDGGESKRESDDSLNNYLQRGHTPSHHQKQRQLGAMSLGDLSPLNSQDIPGMLSKDLSSTDTERYSHQMQRRRQKGLLKHLIRFG